VDWLAAGRDPERADLVSWGAIDWAHTQAYVDADRGLRINLLGREKQGTVRPGKEYEAIRTRLISQLTELVDSDTGLRAIKRVYRREELYAGPFFDEAPDLVVEPVRDRTDYGANYAEHGLNPAAPGVVFAPSRQLTGNHTRDGILIAAGPAFRRGVNLGKVDILDVVPTALHVLGMPLRTDLDGRVLSEALDERGAGGRPLRYEDCLVEDSDHQYRPEHVFTEDETEELAEHLRGLGYLD
jgi:predicted AlkP superfamily phosphohydrolase/phosphomutase